MQWVDGFENKIDTMTGVYCDATAGFENLRKLIEEKQKNNPEISSVADLDKAAFMYGRGLKQ